MLLEALTAFSFRVCYFSLLIPFMSLWMFCNTAKELKLYQDDNFIICY